MLGFVNQYFTGVLQLVLLTNLVIVQPMWQRLCFGLPHISLDGFAAHQTSNRIRQNAFKKIARSVADVPSAAIVARIWKNGNAIRTIVDVKNGTQFGIQSLQTRVQPVVGDSVAHRVYVCELVIGFSRAAATNSKKFVHGFECNGVWWSLQSDAIACSARIHGEVNQNTFGSLHQWEALKQGIHLSRTCDW